MLLEASPIMDICCCPAKQKKKACIRRVGAQKNCRVTVHGQCLNPTTKRKQRSPLFELIKISSSWPASIYTIIVHHNGRASSSSSFSLASHILLVFVLQFFCVCSVSLPATQNASSFSARWPCGQPNRLGCSASDNQLWYGPRSDIRPQQRRHFVQGHSICNSTDWRLEMDSSHRTIQLDWGSQCDILWS